MRLVPFPALISTLLVLFSAATSFAGIDRSERDLVAIVNLSILKNGRLNYRYEENRAVKKIRRELGAKYRRLRILTGKNATHDAFLAEVDAAEADPAVKAIDVIVYLHGHPGAIGFVDTGFYPMDRLRDEVLALSGASSGKLRALYSDACYGASHVDDWLRAGFRVAAGAIGSDENWSLDMKKFMVAWRKGKTFGTAIDRANSVWATTWMDKIGGGDSFKRGEGAIDFTIDHSPADITRP